MTIPKKCTLLELVQSVNSRTENDNEVVALVSYLINSGRVKLCGTFAGAKVSLSRAYLKRGRRAVRPPESQPAHGKPDRCRFRALQRSHKE